MKPYQIDSNIKNPTVTPLGVLAKIALIIWLVETLIMISFMYLPKMSDLTETIIDASVLSICASLGIWFLIIRPLKIYAINESTHLVSLKSALDASAIVTITDVQGKIIYANEKFSEISGFSQEEIIGKDHRIINSDHHSKDFFKELWRTIKAGQVWRGELRNRRKDGSFYWVDSAIVPMRNESGKIASFISIRHDISSRKKLEHDLVNLKEEAEKAALSKARFLANMSHEIRTPMNGIIGMANLLSADVVSKSGHERLRVIQNCGSTLLDIINDILDFSKLEAGKVNIESIPYSLRNIMQELSELFSSRASEKGIVFSYSIQEGAPDFFKGDPTRVKQILNNLISNAIKFTHKGSVGVSIIPQKLADETWDLRFHVKDTGVGIPPEVREKLFQSFSQADASTTRKFGGTGLGLIICKELCKKMGGDISVLNSSERGSTFTFNIVTEIAGKQEFESTAERREKVDPKMADSHPLRILIAEDNRINQLVAIGLLGKFGYQADVVANGLQAVEALKEKTYDLVLMDCHMPEMDGFHATETIQQNIPKESRPRIVALTASALQEDIDRCFSCGMDGYISKPVNVETLRKELLSCRRNPGEIIKEKPVPSAAEEPVFDESAFNANFKGLEDVATNAIEVLFETAPQMFRDLDTAIQSNDAYRIELAAHTIKGVASNFFAAQVQLKAWQIEQFAHGNDLDSVKDLFEELKIEFDKLQNTLKNLKFKRRSA